MGESIGSSGFQRLNSVDSSFHNSVNFYQVYTACSLLRIQPDKVPDMEARVLLVKTHRHTKSYETIQSRCNTGKDEVLSQSQEGLTVEIGSDLLTR